MTHTVAPDTKRSALESRGQNCNGFRDKEEQWHHRSGHLASATQTLPGDPARHAKSAEPLEDHVLQMAVVGGQLSSPRRHTLPWMLGLLLPHLDCIALPHCQPISASPDSAPLQTQHPFSPSPQTLPGVTLCCWSRLHDAPRACRVQWCWGGGGRRGKATRAMAPAASAFGALL